MDPLQMFIGMNILQIQQIMVKTLMFSNCAALVIQSFQEIPWNVQEEWVDSNHFCLPLILVDIVGKDKIRKETDVWAILFPKEETEKNGTKHS